jgi:hypothetical protein
MTQGSGDLDRLAWVHELREAYWGGEGVPTPDDSPTRKRGRMLRLYARTHFSRIPPLRCDGRTRIAAAKAGRAPRTAANARRQGSRRGASIRGPSSDDPDPEPEPPSRRRPCELTPPREANAMSGAAQIALPTATDEGKGGANADG